MKKTFSYLLPAAALLLLAVVGIRWLNSRNAQNGQISQSAEGIEITDLTGGEQMTLGVNDAKSISLTVPESSEVTGTGELRLGEKIENSDRIPFTLIAQLPELKADEGFYQVWFEGERGPAKAMRLVREKTGYVVDGALTSQFDQVKVIISKETQDDAQVEEVVLEGNVELEE